MTGVGGAQSANEAAAILAAKLAPSNLRFTMAFAGLFQLTHEMLKTSIIDKLREFYWRGLDENGPRYDEAGYERDVLSPSRSGGKPRPFKATCV